MLGGLLSFIRCSRIDNRQSGPASGLIDPNLPLRTIPLEVQVFTPTAGRLRPEHLVAMEIQKQAVAEWTHQMERRFASAERERPICDIQLLRQR